MREEFGQLNGRHTGNDCIQFVSRDKRVSSFRSLFQLQLGHIGPGLRNWQDARYIYLNEWMGEEEEEEEEEDDDDEEEELVVVVEEE